MSFHTICYCAEWDDEQWDMLITFEVESYLTGSAPSWNDPGYASEYEFKIVSIDHDVPKGQVADVVHDGLRAVVEAWFLSDKGYLAAAEKADDDLTDEWCYDDE